MKPLSDRLQWMFDNNYMDWDIVADAIQLAKSVETGPEATVMRLNGVLILSDIDADCFSLIGQRVALVPLPQQSET